MRLKRCLIVGALVALLCGLLASGMPVCPSAALLSLPCPGCGLSRATLAALRGDFVAAFAFHPLFFVLSPLVAGVLVRGVWNYVLVPEREPTTSIKPTTSWVLASMLAAMLGVYALRFAGYFGGPAPVATWLDWAQTLNMGIVDVNSQTLNRK